MEKKIKLLCPVNTIESAKAQVRVGADEIYVGLSMANLHQFSFSGRSSKIDKIKTNPDIQSLREIVKICHDKGVAVNFTANSRYLTNDSAGGNSLFKNYIDYVRQAIECGIDNVIVGNLTNITLLEKENIDIPVHCGVYLNIINQEQVNYIKTLKNVKRIVLPYNILYSEIKQLTGLYRDIEFEIFCHLGCSTINSQCRLLHDFGDESLGVSYRNLYCVTGENQTAAHGIPFMDMGLDCSICSLPDLIKTDVSVLKIVGRDMHFGFVASITKIYRNCLDMAYEGADKVELLRMVSKLLPGYENIFCINRRCKYLEDQPVYRYYI